MKINNITIKEPAKVQVGLSDVDGKSYRNAKGRVIRDRICGGENAKRKIEISWSAMTTEEMSTLLQAVKDKEFSCTYLDPYTGTDRTATFYVGDRTAPVYSFVKGIITWESLSMNFIEC